MTIKKKVVISSAVDGGIASAISVVTGYTIQGLDPSMPPEVVGAICILVTAGLLAGVNTLKLFLASYYKKLFNNTKPRLP